MPSLFEARPTELSTLFDGIKSGRIGLPDLQRPYVWKDAKVRDLLDSMLKGYPIGYVMIWLAPEGYDATANIGTNAVVYQSNNLVVDGQQRLTGLYSAIYGVEIVDKDYKTRRIRISFNPLTREFAVWSQAYERAVEWISDIHEVFKARNDDKGIAGLRKKFIKSVNENRERLEQQLLTEDDEISIENGINDLKDLLKHSVPTLEIKSTASEEDVADIFVRVNSGGQKLTEKNFIETLLAVYDKDVHDRIAAFCRESRIPAQGGAYNQMLDVEPSHLIRIAVGCAFHRARLKYAYLLMRGKDLETGLYSESSRTESLEKFRKALELAMNPNTWHAFLNIFSEAGYVNHSLIASSNAVVFSYVLYLIGINEYKTPVNELRKTLARWIFMATVTGFYTGSTESEVEKQFADLKLCPPTPSGFLEYLEKTIKSKLTDDFFAITLPKDLETSSVQSPAWYAYLASLNVLGNQLLFGNKTLRECLALGASGTKNAVDIHHVFPKKHLADIGFTDDRIRNQIANYTPLEYQTNIDIGDEPPSVYALAYKEKMDEEAYIRSCRANALPDHFESMPYLDFLQERRLLMAQMVKKAFDRLCM